MSIPEVTDALKSLLEDYLVRFGHEHGVGNASVTLNTPDRVGETAGAGPTLNLFMYRIEPHVSLRNNLNPRNPPESQMRAVPVALQLHYLISSHSDEGTGGDALLNIAIQALYEQSVLRLNQRFNVPTGAKSNRSGTAGSNAPPTAEADEPAATITPEFLSFEETARLWTALQAKLRPAIVFSVRQVTLSTIQK